MAANKKTSTMAKLLLQSRPPQNHHQLSTLTSSSATLRLVAAPSSTVATVPTQPSSSSAAGTLILTPANNVGELTVLPVLQATPVQQSTATTSQPPQQIVVNQPPSNNQPVMVRFSERQLAEMSLKELNHYLKGLSKEEAAEVKRMRRAAKNKSYAVIQREKRHDDVQRLSARKMRLNEEIAAANFRKVRIADELSRVRKETNSLLALGRRLKIEVPSHIYDLRPTSSAESSSTTASTQSNYAIQ